MVTIFEIFLVVHILKKTYAEDDTFVRDLISTQVSDFIVQLLIL